MLPLGQFVMKKLFRKSHIRARSPNEKLLCNCVCFVHSFPGYLDASSLILERGGNVNAVGDDNKTALMNVLEGGNVSN